MKEHMTDLNVLAKKYNDIIKSLEGQIDEARKKAAVVSEALELLKKEGILSQEKLFPDNPPVLSDEYKDLTLPDAVLDILGSMKGGADDIFDQLMMHGFKSNSKDLRRDLYARLNRMEGKGLITSKKEGRRKIYSLPKPEEVKS